MMTKSCIPVIPSFDLERSLRFWVQGVGLGMDRPMRADGLLIGCMVQGQGLSFWLNQRAGTLDRVEGYEGIRLYWTPHDIHAMHDRLQALGYAVSAIEEREYGQTEFHVVDDDGHAHCFGVPTR